MKWILKILVSGLAVFITAYILPGVSVVSFWSALLVALVLGLLNVLVKPILIVLSLPITILTLGFFLLVINALVVLFASYLVSGFDVNGFWSGFLFSIVLSFIAYMLNKIIL